MAQCNIVHEARLLYKYSPPPGSVTANLVGSHINTSIPSYTAFTDDSYSSLSVK